MRRSVLRVVRRMKVTRVMSTKLLGSCIGSPVVLFVGLCLVATFLWLLLSG